MKYDQFLKLYQFFKKGKVESNFVISIGSFIMLIALSLNQEITVPFVITVSLAMIFGFLLVGKVTINKIESEYFRLLPFYNDSTKADILLYEAIIEKDDETARDLLRQAIELKKKWV